MRSFGRWRQRHGSFPRGHHRRWRRSIFPKLFFILLVTGLFINFFVFGGLRFFIFPNANFHPLMSNLDAYVSYLIQDLGSPPDLAKGKAIAARTGLSVRWESESGAGWATDSAAPRAAEIPDHWRRGSPSELRVGHLRGGWAVTLQRGPEHFIFFTRVGLHPEARTEYVLLLIGCLSLLLGVSFLAIRRLLAPVRLLKVAVDRLRRGDLSTQVAVVQQDELGELAGSFNEMTAQLRDTMEAREQLLLDVSHELRSPITRMQLSLEFFEDPATKLSLAEDLALMERMIRELLENARLSNPNGGLVLSSLDLPAWLSQWAEGMRRSVPRLAITVGAGPFPMEVDPERLRIVLTNLVENAAKYSPPEGAIEVKLLRETAMAVITVEDEGLGIPAEELERVFEPFYRVDKSRQRETGGFGLGLSLCRKIARAHGGDLQLERRAVGTRAVLRLPRKPASKMSS